MTDWRKSSRRVLAVLLFASAVAGAATAAAGEYLFAPSDAAPAASPSDAAGPGPHPMGGPGEHHHCHRGDGWWAWLG